MIYGDVGVIQRVLRARVLSESECEEGGIAPEGGDTICINNRNLFMYM